MTIVSAVPFTLQNGTIADATQVMADFNSIKNDVNANAAANGANNDITSLSGLTTPLSVAQGGTGQATSLGAAGASFQANKGGSNQTISSTSATQVTFGTEVFDVGSHFATDAWTPPAGTCSLSIGIGFASLTAAEPVQVKLYKNGSSYKVTLGVANASGELYLQLALAAEQCNGTDVYAVYADSQADASYDVLGGATVTWFAGTLV